MMVPMDVTATAEFAAPPTAVFAMLTDRDYLDRLAQASDPLRHEARVDGRHTTSTRTLPAPSQARRFTGDELTVVEDVTWAEPAADGSAEGRIEMTVPRQPVIMNGTLTLAPGGRGTVLRLSGELKVNIPLLGRKMEAAAAPAVLAGFEDHQQVGDAWLAEHA